MTRILITGSRHWSDPTPIASALTQAWEDLGRPEQVTLIHGDCPTGGADHLAATIAAQRGWAVEAHPADWDTHGRAAGPLRNQKMVDLGADLTLAFPSTNSRGTWDCVRRAHAEGIPVRTITETTGPTNQTH